MYSTREEVENWLIEMGIENYVINEDLTVDVQGSVKLSYKELKEMPIKFRIVDGDFICDLNSLISLKGCPKVVNGDFNCSFNNLTSLKGSPEIVNGSFYCINNKITDLKGCSEIIGSNFNCSCNELENLEGCPKVIKRDFNCSNNKLTNLKNCAQIVNGDFNCSCNELENLEGSLKEVSYNFYCSNNNLTSLEGMLFAGGNLYCDNNKIKDLSHLNINNVKDIYLNNNEISECNWIDNTEEKGLFSKISLLFREIKKIDLSNNNISEKSLLLLKNTNNKIVIKLTDNKDLYLSEEYNEQYLNLFKLKNNLINYQDKKIALIKKELNIFKNEMRDEFKSEKIIKKRKL